MRDTVGGVAELVRRAKAYDRGAFGEIYRQTVKPVYRYLSSRVNVTQEAEELTQEVFLAALGAIGNLRAVDEATLLAWLFQIARHKLADHFRRRYRHQASSLDEAERVLSGEAGPEDLAEAAEERGAIREALDRLTPEQREVLLYKYVLDYDNTLTSQLVGKNTNAVNQLHHRALLSLQRILSKSKGLQ